ncbi:hypothetical protein SAMN05421869_107372 [Nonomuraea jiangxiensis]|uniref:Uncharacterized protein n=1 Tax=Nonomuraea jiangxiensis TaxID=633440 RepID=A0A1G8P9A4_9ACTN|nr:hypothetical protein SAMN05421869_107372 [Nonomuraea jiangxiensis]
MRVCKELDSLRAVLPDDDQSPIRQLLTAVRTRQDSAEPLQAVHAALRAMGDHLGVWGHRSVTMAGVGTRQPFEPVYLCPQGRYSGRRVDETTTFPLTCAITGQELRRERL